MPQTYETYMKTFRKLVIGLLLFHLLFTCVYLLVGLSDIRGEKNELEAKQDLNLDPSRYDLATMILCGSSFMNIIIIALGLFGVYFQSFCILLFFSTTGTGIFILLIITMIVEHIISFLTAMFMVLLTLVTSTFAIYFAFEINRYKDYYRPKLPHDADYTNF